MAAYKIMDTKVVEKFDESGIVSTAEPLRNERLAATTAALECAITMMPPEVCQIMADYRELLGTFSLTHYA